MVLALASAPDGHAHITHFCQVPLMHERSPGFKTFHRARRKAESSDSGAAPPPVSSTPPPSSCGRKEEDFLKKNLPVM